MQWHAVNHHSDSDGGFIIYSHRTNLARLAIGDGRHASCGLDSAAEASVR